MAVKATIVVTGAQFAMLLMGLTALVSEGTVLHDVHKVELAEATIDHLLKTYTVSSAHDPAHPLPNSLKPLKD